ncbi:MAG: site-specific integrase [Clostridia bacterium]|nr:site-specific integrase [Clostridia bacterium]
MTYSHWLQQWMDIYMRPKVTTSTTTMYVHLIKTLHKHFPDLMQTEIEEIKHVMLQDALNTLSTHLSKSTLQKIRSIFTSSLCYAVKNNLITSSPSNGLTVPRNACEKNVDGLTVNEQARLEKAALNDPLGHVVIFFLYTGLRRSELQNLKWSDVDLCQGWLNIQTSKTEAGVRRVPLTSRMVALLTDLHHDGIPQNAYVFQTSTSQQISTEVLKGLYLRLRKAANLPNLTTHVYRHTFATRAIEKGIEVTALSKILGHTNPAFTTRRYVHPDQDYLKNQLLKVFE